MSEPCDHLYRSTTMVCVLCGQSYGEQPPYSPPATTHDVILESRTDPRDDLKRPEHGGKPSEPIEQFVFDGKVRRIE